MAAPNSEGGDLTKEMEVELKRVVLARGKGLLKPGDSLEELLRKLDKLEHLLQHIGQGRKPLIELELKPAEDALISNALLRHDEVDVRVTVVSCITEIIRIKAPEEPYSEDQMKDYFKLVNTAYRKLPSMAGRNYANAVSLIQAVSSCQICVRMLDFELHNTILEMFHLFLDGIQSSHPQEIFSSMEHIMTLIIQNIEESDEFMVELIKIFLAALKKGNKNISPCAFQLAKKVFEKCADSLHNFVPEAVRHMGDAVQEYDDAIASSLLGATRSDNMNVEEMGTRACDREQVNLDGDPIISMLEENCCIDNLKAPGSIDENHATVPYSDDHNNCQENVSLEAKGMGIEASYHKEVNLQDEENVNENHQKMAHVGDQINWRESDLERINSTSGPDGSTPCLNNNNSDEMRNSGSLTEQNLLPLHATLTPLRQVSPVKDGDTIHDEDSLEKQNTPDATIPVNIEGAHFEQQNLKRGDIPILKKRSRKPNSRIKPEEGYDPLWMLCELASKEGSHHRKRGRNDAGFQKKNTISKLSKSSSSSGREPMNAELRSQKKFTPEKKDNNYVYLLSSSVKNLGETVASKNIVDEECSQEKLEKSPEIHLLTCTTYRILKNPVKRKRSVMKPRKKFQSKNIVFEAETSKDSTQTLVLHPGNRSSQVESHSTKVSNPPYLLHQRKRLFLRNGNVLWPQKLLEKQARERPLFLKIKQEISMSKILAETTSSEGKGHSKDISGSKRWRSEIPYKEKNYPKKRKQSSAKKAFGETSKREDAFSENEMGDIVIVTMTSQSKEKAHSQEAAITHASKLSYKEEASKVNHSTKSNGQDLVGCKIKVWWRLDKTYYEGKVMSFDNLKKTHQVDYDDGETEILDLAKEHWEVITDYSLCSHDTRIVKAPPVTPSVVGFENKLWG